MNSDSKPFFNLETSSPFRSTDINFQISGTVCGVDPPPLVRARVGAGKAFVAEFCPPRPSVQDIDDLHAAQSDRSSQQHGFVVNLIGTQGAHQLRLEMKVGKRWRCLHKSEVTFCFEGLIWHIDCPIGEIVSAGEVAISGWCLYTSSPISGLQIQCNQTRFDTTYGLERKDVGQVYPKITSATMSGFEAIVAVVPGRYRLSLVAELADGRVVKSGHLRTLIVQGDSQLWMTRVLLALLLPFRFVAFSYSGARQWHRHNGRIPRVRELGRLATRAVHGFQQMTRASRYSHYRLPDRALPYNIWVHNNRLSQADASQIQRALGTQRQPLPTISIVIPVYNPPKGYFEAVIASIESQICDRWELCIADDASTQSWVWPELQRLAAKHLRIKVVRRTVNGDISLATNTAAELAVGDYLLFVDQDDLLSPDAVACLALAISDEQQPDLLYSDDDKVSTDGTRYAPQFKPDWSPELLLSYMYLSHALCVRTALFRKLGGFRVGFEGSQDYDFALRATEVASTVVHVPRVLYHWRAIEGSTAQSGAAKPHSFEAGRKAVEQALHRRGVAFDRVFRPDWAVKGALGVFTHQFAHNGPNVTILIPSKNNKAVLKRCLDSLQQTQYQNYQVVVIDNASDDAQTIAYLQAQPHKILRIPNQGDAFSYAYINNEAVRQVDTDYVLFLNDDTEVIHPQWLSQMMGYAQIVGVGVVGARLLYPNNTIQHAGVIHGVHNGFAGHAFKLNAAQDFGYLAYANVLRNYSAVTAACMLTKRSLFEQVGGFDEMLFAVAYNDVDYCYRVLGHGYRCVYAPSAELIHHEGLSRGYTDCPAEVLAFKEKYRHFVDAYYSRWLSLGSESFEINTRRLADYEAATPAALLLCSHNLNLEGAPYCLLELAIELQRRGEHKPIVFSPVDGPLRLEYERHGIVVHVDSTLLRGVTDEAGFEGGIEQFSQWVKGIGVDLIFANTLQTFYAICCAQRLVLPCIWTIHESEPWQTYFQFLPRTLETQALDCFQYPYANIFVSQQTRKGFEALNTQRNFRVIPNGLNPAILNSAKKADLRQSARANLTKNPTKNPNHGLAIADNEVVVLSLGTVCERKGQLDLVQAVGMLSASALKNLRVFIVGDRDGDYSRRLHLAIDALDEFRRSRIAVVAETRNTANYYGAADLFVCTSRIESYPRVILEAMAFGLPIITTPCFGIREQVRSGVNADFYHEGDIKGLAGALEGLIQDHAKRREYATNAGLVLAALPGFDEMMSNYAEVVNEALSVNSVDMPWRF